ncbi:hypothetical protein CQA11_28285 [Klebsiella pneumoniae]|nr:hypothetical protein CQA12_27800 [Klebsiella pneumoniae]PCP86032.1 hypothetical protein CQA11_28285 [Klebsiella pneumoniae]PCP96359.1 hypothetical protein CQA13_28330 [Klebsiella pneumoniae]PCR47034.1 hypothetical protein CQA88_26345 [Klebsiella pneumoniae]
MPAFEWVHVQLHQQKGMISLSPPTICNSACLVAKSAINLDAFQLPFRVLVEGADPDIPNALSSHGIPCKMSGKTL